MVVACSASQSQTMASEHGAHVSHPTWLTAIWPLLIRTALRLRAEPTCVVVKHTNPCGIASRGDLQEAYRLAVRADPVSAFGGIVAFNRCTHQPQPLPH